jgi:hypothetical protein
MKKRVVGIVRQRTNTKESGQTKRAVRRGGKKEPNNKEEDAKNKDTQQRTAEGEYDTVLSTNVVAEQIRSEDDNF